jgi:hypothetical protein
MGDESSGETENRAIERGNEDFRVGVEGSGDLNVVCEN